MTPTGRRIAAPGLDLVEVIADSGLKHLALVHHEVWREHPLLSADVPARLPWMEDPEVSGIARLVSHDGGAFLYPTGTVWTVAEVVHACADAGDAAGVKVGLELAYLVGESLTEAAEAAAAHGILAHGNVNPWTLALKGDGQPLVLGFGIPQVELGAWREDQRLHLGEDSFRYAPPERIEGSPDDASSDLFSLALVALELMVGRPVYDGVLADVKQQATRGEGARRLYQWRDKLPQNVREVLGRALKPDPDTRFATGMDFVHAVHDLLGSIDVEGPSLTEVMAKVRASQRRDDATAGDPTPPITPTEAGPTDEGEQPRWRKPARRSDGGSPTPAPATSRATDPARERLRRRLRESRSTAAGPSDAAPRLETDDGEIQTGDGVIRVTRAGRASEVPARPRERAAAFVLRAALETGGFPVDLTGRITGAFHLFRDGREVPPDALVEPGSYALEPVPADVRVVELEIGTEPPTRLRTPLSLAVPAGWLVRGLADWLGLGEGWALRVDGATVPPDRLLADVLGTAGAISVVREP